LNRFRWKKILTSDIGEIIYNFVCRSKNSIKTIKMTLRYALLRLIKEQTLESLRFFDSHNLDTLANRQDKQFNVRQRV